MPARGVIYVHSCPAAVSPHVEWALGRVLGYPVNLDWKLQPAQPGTRRAEYQWQGKVGWGAELAAALTVWGMLRFEVTEEPTTGVDGERFAHVPGRGLHQSTMSANGDVLIREGRLRNLIATARGPEALAHGLENLLGTAWDTDLEPYRRAAAEDPSYLQKVG